MFFTQDLKNFARNLFCHQIQEACCPLLTPCAPRRGPGEARAPAHWHCSSPSFPKQEGVAQGAPHFCKLYSVFGYILHFKLKLLLPSESNTLSEILLQCTKIMTLCWIYINKYTSVADLRRLKDSLHDPHLIHAELVITFKNEIRRFVLFQTLDFRIYINSYIVY